MKKKFSPFGKDLFGDQIHPNETSPLKKQFIVAPFSILNTREGGWQERKAAWLSIGIESEVGRAGNLLEMSDTILEPNAEKRAKNKLAKSFNTSDLMVTDEMIQARMKASPGGMSEANIRAQIAGEQTGYSGGTSIFDPVLCELCYEWFCPPRGQIIDPFSGGSVRGITAAMLGKKYWGCDLRQEQVDANYEQATRICPSNKPTWVCGDSSVKLQEAPDSDFVFSCPPYFDLEVYSEDEKDLSAMSWEQFVDVYRLIISQACERLRDDRFAAFVVGDVRDKKGHYRNFVGETINAFRDAGLAYYNEIILVNAVGTLALRVPRQFNAGRKVGKSHQNVLVFCKGDWRKAANAINFSPPPRPTIPPRRKT